MSNISKIGVSIMVFISIIIGLILLQSSAQNLDESLNQVSIVNQSIVFPADGVGVVLNARYREISNVVVQNTSWTISSGNYSINNSRLVDGAFAGAQIVGVGSGAAGVDVNVSYDAKRLEYMDNAGGRSLASLIIIFFAIAIFVIAMLPIIKERIFSR